jgi:predicted DNA-binding transcriptional regulator AlpA
MDILHKALCQMTENLRQEMLAVARQAAQEAMKEAGPPKPQGLMTAKDVFGYLQIGRTAFYDLLREHPDLRTIAITITTTKDGRNHLRWRQQDVDAWIERRAQASSSSEPAPDLDDAA